MGQQQVNYYEGPIDGRGANFGIIRHADGTEQAGYQPPSPDDDWAEGYQRAQARWTGMRPEDYPPAVDETGRDAS